MSDNSNLEDDQITSTGPTEADDNRDAAGHGSQDSGDEPTEAEDDKDAGSHGAADTGDAG